MKATRPNREPTQEKLALLKLLAQGRQDVEAGCLIPVNEVAAQLRARLARRGRQKTAKSSLKL